MKRKTASSEAPRRLLRTSGEGNSFCPPRPPTTTPPHTASTVGLLWGQREVRAPQWDQNTLCAAQRAPARYGVEFGLKIVSKPALCPPSDPRHHLARCYRCPGSVVEADAERSQQKRQRKQGTGWRQVARVGRASDQQRGRVDGQWAWELAIRLYSSVALHI